PQGGPYEVGTPRTDRPGRPTPAVLLLHAVAERQRWKAEYTAAQLATNGSPRDNRSATDDQAA
ncbi:MAG: replication initiator protein, partial [Actinomycetota bacterium]|nr:replication initiator protein [Actinomycetota bacterium]